MSITSRINEMSSHIEQAYDELQGLGADLTNVNKNIENISMVLDDIYDSMPQVSGEGTSLTLEDTRVGKIKSTLKGNTSQSGTPTPTSPIPVNVVSGDNEINVVGKNLFNPTETWSNWYGTTCTINNQQITWSGTSTAGISRKIADVNLPSGAYTISLQTISGSHTSDKHIWIDYMQGNTKIASDNFTQDGSKQRTLSDMVDNIKIGFDGADTFNNYTFVIQIEKGSSASSYLPYSGNTYNIDLPVENLFDISTNTNEKVIASDGTITDDSKFTISDYIKVSPSTIYTISWVYDSSQGSDTAMRVASYQSDKTFISRPYNTTSPYVITTPNNCYYIRICYHLASHTQVQVEKGTKQNSFTPYGTTPIELCKIGNYQDYFGKSNGRNLYVNDKNTHTFQQNNASWRFIDGTGGASGSDLDTKTIYKARVYNGITYTFSSNITASSSIVSQIVYEDETLIKRIDGATATFNETFTASRDGYVILRLYVGANISVSVSNVMLNEGSTALPYEPYGVGKWYLHKEIGKVVLNGSESWAYALQSNVSRFDITIPNAVSGSATNNPILSTHFKTEFALVDKRIFLSGYGNTIAIMDNDFSNTNDFKNWLSSNNVTCYYGYTTSTTTEITYEPLITQLNLLEKAMSKDGQTNISQVNNDLPFIISASALKEWQESASLNSTLSMVNPLSLGNTLNTQENDIQPIEVDNIEPLEEEENEES